MGPGLIRSLWISVWGTAFAWAQMIELPEPRRHGDVSVEQALEQRRSVREFSADSLSLDEAGQLLWSAQGLTSDWGGRTTPSAGATYPLECYLVTGKVTGLEPGVYHYLCRKHSLEPVKAGDWRSSLAQAALGQEFVEAAPANIVIAADFSRTTRRYGERGRRYVYIEVGHCAENVHLECEALGLGMVCVGAFDDRSVKKLLEIQEEPIYILSVGRKP